MKTIISYRLDDICPKMDHEKFYKTLSIFSEFGIFPLLGVVPDCKDSKLNIMEKENDMFWKNIKDMQQEGYAIALHGYQHVYSTQNGGNLEVSPKSEFAGLSYDKQYNKLKKAKEIMNSYSVKPLIFMAPSHSFDINTLKALRNLDITMVTDGLSNRPYERFGMKFIPCKNVISLQRKLAGICVICIHTNTMEEIDFVRLKKFLIKYRLQSISYIDLMKGDFIRPILPAFYEWRWKIFSTIENKSVNIISRIIGGIRK